MDSVKGKLMGNSIIIISKQRYQHIALGARYAGNFVLVICKVHGYILYAIPFSRYFPVSKYGNIQDYSNVQGGIRYKIW